MTTAPAAALASLSAYTIARLKVRWTETLLRMSALSRMVPLIVLMVPLYVLFRTYGLLNSLSGAAASGLAMPSIGSRLNSQKGLITRMDSLFLCRRSIT